MDEVSLNYRNTRNIYGYGVRSGVQIEGKKKWDDLFSSFIGCACANVTIDGSSEAAGEGSKSTDRGKKPCVPDLTLRSRAAVDPRLVFVISKRTHPFLGFEKLCWADPSQQIYFSSRSLPLYAGRLRQETDCAKQLTAPSTAHLLFLNITRNSYYCANENILALHCANAIA